MLREFLDEYNIVPMTLSADSPTSYSYCHETLQHYSLLDYFCVSVDLVSQVSNVATIDIGNNLSDHLPVVLRLHLPSDLVSDIAIFVLKRDVKLQLTQA